MFLHKGRANTKIFAWRYIWIVDIRLLSWYFSAYPYKNEAVIAGIIYDKNFAFDSFKMRDFNRKAFPHLQWALRHACRQTQYIIHMTECRVRSLRNRRPGSSSQAIIHKKLSMSSTYRTFSFFLRGSWHHPDFLRFQKLEDFVLSPFFYVLGFNLRLFLKLLNRIFRKKWVLWRGRCKVVAGALQKLFKGA